MKIEMTSKDGVTLLTAGKYCKENIQVIPTFEMGGGGSAEIITKYAYSGGTAVPNTGTIENIYWNISLTMEEINTIIQNANLTYVDFEGMPVYGAYALFDTNGTPLSLVGMADFSAMLGGLPAYVAIDMVTNAMLFCTSDLLAAEMGIPAGWDASLVANAGETSIGGILISSLADMGFGSVGAENDKLINLFSASQYTKTAVETMPLSGTYDSNNLTITNNQNIDIKNSIETNKIIPLSISIEIPDKLKDRLRGYLTDISPEYLEEVGTLSKFAFAGCEVGGTVVIPSAQIGSPIKTGTFMNSIVENVIIPEGITGIDDGAFAECGLANINIPASVTYIGYLTDAHYGAFEGSSLVNITFAQNNQLSYIRKRAFARCYNLKQIQLPENITKIEDETFYNSGLQNITIPSNITEIGKKAFIYNYSLESVVIPNTIIRLWESAFEQCSSLLTVNYLGTVNNWVKISFVDQFSNPLNNNNAQLIINNEIVTSPTITVPIGKYAFAGYKHLTSVSFAGDVYNIEDGAFMGTSLTSISIPTRVTIISSSVFRNCLSLSSVAMHDQINTIESYAFYQCKALTSIVMPANLKAIEEYAFYNCTAMQLYDFRNATIIPTIGAYTFQFIPTNCKIVVPDALYDYWIISGNWATYASKIVKASEYTE